MNLELSGTSTKYDDDHETKSILRRVEEEKKVVSLQFAAWGSSIMEFDRYLICTLERKNEVRLLID